MLVAAPKERAAAATCKPRPAEPDTSRRITRADLYDWILRLIDWGDSCAAAMEAMKEPAPEL